MKKGFGFLVVSMLLIMGCGSIKPVAVAKQTFTFDYTPKVSNKSGSVGMVLSFIQPYYANTFSSSGVELFRSFRQALGNDIEELIISKGFTLKGPYQAFDEMVFEDKKRTDVTIQIEIVPDFTSSEGSWKESYIPLIGSSFSYSGKTSLVGKINLTGIEPMTNEKIWSKSVLIPKVENILIQTSGKYTRPLESSELYQDAGVYNAIGKALQEQYAGIMDKVAAHFNPEEFSSLKNQIKELKSKKGF
jgi:hypothetical protein